MFEPTEIIFSSTSACNLHCDHCFVSRNPQKLSIEDAKNFISSCKKAPNSQIQKIGFSGGEPFLYFEFLLEITKFTIEQDLLFDQIMTNGDWWKTEEDLNEKLQALYNAGYDGKFGVSYDEFHGQTPQRMTTFISSVQKIFGNDSVNIQSVGNSLPLEVETTIYTLPQTFQSEDEHAWKAKKWFKDDYCEGPGNIFYVHSNGNIAPCCGFANENPELFIGKITDSFETIMNNAKNNKLVKICFETGLGKYRHQIKKQMHHTGKKFPGKCNDICSFCDYVCKNFNLN